MTCLKQMPPLLAYTTQSTMYTMAVLCPVRGTHLFGEGLVWGGAALQARHLSFGSQQLLLGI